MDTSSQKADELVSAVERVRTKVPLEGTFTVGDFTVEVTDEEIIFTRGEVLAALGISGRNFYGHITRLRYFKMGRWKSDVLGLTYEQVGEEFPRFTFKWMNNGELGRLEIWLDATTSRPLVFPVTGETHAVPLLTDEQLNNRQLRVVDIPVLMDVS